MQNNTISVTGEQSLPNCIILDEIDGVDSRDTINMILEIAKQPLHRPGDHESGKGSKKKASHLFALTRPLICICNDLYSPVLKNLRRYAKVFIFTLPNELKLVSRLRQI